MIVVEMSDRRAGHCCPFHFGVAETISLWFHPAFGSIDVGFFSAVNVFRIAGTQRRRRGGAARTISRERPRPAPLHQPTPHALDDPRPAAVGRTKTFGWKGSRWKRSKWRSMTTTRRALGGHTEEKGAPQYSFRGSTGKRLCMF